MSTTVSSSPSDLPTFNWRILLLALGMFALGTDAFVVAGVLPVIGQELQVSLGLAGQLVTAFSLTYGLGAPLFAALTGRWPRTQVLLTALAAFCVANIASAIAPSFPLLLLTRILAGCFAATFAPLAYATATTLVAPARRGQALALVVFGLTVANVFGSPLGTWVGEHFGWRLSFGLVALLAGIAFVALLLSRLPASAGSTTLTLKQRLLPLGQGHILLAMLPALLWNLAFYICYTYIAPLLHVNLHINDISGLLVIFGIGLVLGNLCGGTLVDRFGVQRLLIGALVTLTLIFATLFLTLSNVFSAIVALFIWGGLGILTFLGQQQRLLKLAPEHANVILALNNSTLYLGIAGGSALGGVLFQATSQRTLTWIAASIVILALLLLTLSLRAEKQRQTTQISARDVVQAEAGEAEVVAFEEKSRSFVEFSE